MRWKRGMQRSEREERKENEEEEALLVKKERGRKLLAEVQAGNQQQIELKKQVLQVSSC